ncbi:MAG: MMPL family transporter [Gammaproteobacteria bacterium]
MQKANRRFFAALIERPRSWAALIAVIAIVALVRLVDWHTFAPALEVDPSIVALLPRDGADLALLESVRQRFASDDLLLVTWTDDALFTPRHLRAFKALAQHIERMPGVEDVESLATALRTSVHAQYTDVSPFLATIPADAAAARALRDAALANPLYAGYLISHDGRAATIAVRFASDLSSRTLIAMVRDIAAASSSRAAGVHDALSGPLFVRLEISRLLLHDLYRVMPLAIGATLLVAVLGFRHLRGVVLPLLANAIALTVTLSLFTATGHAFNYVTVILPPTVYVVGFAYAVHVVSDFDRHFVAGVERGTAVLAALNDVAYPVTLTALTTALGFASLSLSAIDSIRDFGLWASLGTLLAWAAALSVVPLGLLLMPRLQVRVRRRGGRRQVARLAALAESHAVWALLGGALLAVVSILGASRIQITTDYLENFAPDSELRRDFTRLNTAFAGAVPLQILLEGEQPDSFKSPAALRAVHELQTWLLQQPEIGAVYSLLDYIAELERVLAPDLVDADPVPTTAGVASHLILLGASEDIRRFADPAFASTLLQVRTNAAASADLTALARRIEQRLAELPAGMTGQVTGSSLLIAQTLDEVTRGQVTSLCAALLPIAAVLVVLFRSLRLALIALLPNALPIVAFFGILGWTGVPLNLTTSLVASTVLGIAVDDTIHFFVRLRAAVQHQGERVALRTALDAVMRPVTLTTAALALGFVTLVGGELRSQADFGLLAAATLVIAWLLDLAFTPALARVAGAARGTRLLSSVRGGV